MPGPRLNAGDGRWVRTLSGARYGFNAPYSIASAGGRIWVTNLYPGMADGSVTELNASNGGWIHTLSDGTWIQSLLRGCVPGVLASGGYHFTSPVLVAAVGAHIWVFGRDGVRVLTDPAPRPGRGERQ